ncbi:mucin TcMUCII, putative [Trypanosoma cruzi]|uniref:Mucin TcMUCII, putative n=1 Tax=Trypanosoma cruzi (strain CL Brener) TaxID=353153 RepID=Q4CT84_TRYCC|nr:mucin TcMUCII, putative [Trypanosoma cruzi]EAN83486.1 mucin TcMUCII, putative [Trypanosoma cruzi]|eukprot:XP_805337.1 mucin TcMUCII [Trypanosoma cruzi strain CL Brener]
MMTCRLLCALLVLALCCCPSLCAKAGGEDVAQNSGRGSTLPEGQFPGINSASPADTKLTQAIQTIVVQGRDGSAAGHNPDQPPDRARTQSPTDPRSSESAVAGESSRPANKAVGQGTTNTTKPPTTTTTTITTTTTTTTEAPTTTTTTRVPSDMAMNAEASTTTTTRAPSHPREIDGSLSSSSWVCAPLLLAVSALAYTAVG